MKKSRKKIVAPCQLLSGRKSLGIGTCDLFSEGRPRWRIPQHGANVQLPTPDLTALDRVFHGSEMLTLKIKLKYPDPMDAIFYKVECIISRLALGTSGADLEVMFDGPARRTTSARL